MTEGRVILSSKLPCFGGLFFDRTVADGNTTAAGSLTGGNAPEYPLERIQAAKTGHLTPHPPAGSFYRYGIERERALKLGTVLDRNLHTF